MTVRAVIIGLALGLGVAVFGYFNDWIIFQAYIAGDLIPVSVYGLLIVGMLTINPLLSLSRRWRFQASEWCVIASLMLAGCIVPGPGLMWHLSNTLLAPNYHAEMQPGWQSDRLIEYVPRIMLADPGSDRERVIRGFMEGLGTDKRMISPAEVPWGAWTRTLSFWLPLLALSFAGVICLAVVLHRQWAHRERLRYPVADFAAELVGGSGDRPLPNIFYNRRFWMGFALAAGVLLVNGLAGWSNKLGIRFIDIPMSVNLGPFGRLWPEVLDVQFGDFLLGPAFFFAAVGFAYFLNLEVSFSLGISQVAYVAMFILLSTGLGMDMSGSYLEGGPKGHALFGAYLGLAIVAFYTGRRFYLGILRDALGLGARQAERDAVWACRATLTIAAAMVALLMFAVGLHWLLALLFVCVSGLLFMVMTRISAETGLFFIQPTWHAVTVLLGLFGAAALGPNMLIILGILSIATTVDPRIALMPLAANALKFSESEGVRPGRLGGWMTATVLLALAVGVPATLYVQYNYGGSRYGWPDDAAGYPFKLLQKNLPQMNADPDRWQGLNLGEFRPSKRFLAAAAVGLALALGCGWLRLRSTWWPIHPVLFLVWGTFPMACLAASFFLGWVIKLMICKLGGGKAYESNKPLFVGLIAGEFLAGIFWMLFGLGYYLVTGAPGAWFRVHP